jgi:regulatory protein
VARCVRVPRQVPRRASPSTNKPPPDAFDLAARLLGLRPHSEFELRQKLRRRGCSPNAIEEAMSRAYGLGYLDDAAFANALVARRSRTRGPAIVAAELATKGIDREVARDALRAVDRAAQVATARRLAGGSAHSDRRVVASRLLRRGFAYAVIREALELDLDPD